MVYKKLSVILTMFFIISIVVSGCKGKEVSTSSNATKATSTPITTTSKPSTSPTSQSTSASTSASNATNGVTASPNNKNEKVYNFNDLKVGDTLPADFTWNNFGSASIIDSDNNKVLEMSGGGYNFIFVGDDFEGDFTFECKMKITNHVTKGAGQVNFRENSSAFTGKCGYQFMYGDGQETIFGGELRKRDGTISDTKYSAFENDGKWHTFRIEMKGTTASLFMDDKFVMSQELTGFDSGSIVICSYLDTVLYDDLKIIK